MSIYERPNGAEIGGIYNAYGGLKLRKDAEGWLWGIDSFNGPDWERIPEYLAEALVRFEDEREG